MTETSVNSRPGKRFRILLYASLVLNFLFIGLVAGAVAFGPKDMRRASGPPDMAMPYTRALANEDRRAVRKLMRDQGNSRRAEREALIESYHASLALLRSEPFDQDAFTANLDALVRSAQARQARGQIALINYLSNMPVDARLAYADRLEEALTNLSKRHENWRKPARP